MTNPAHPSIVIRTVVNEGGKMSVRTEADTAADCAAFLDMMAEFNALTAAMIESMS